MKRVKVITFTDVKEARAAFALGQVTYRCLACGQVHRSGTRASRRCRKRLWEDYGWKVVMPFRPPTMLLHKLQPPYAFAELAFSRALSLLPRFEDERFLPEYVLALDERADLQAALEEVVEELTADARKVADRAWEIHRAFWKWLDELARARPPCSVVKVDSDIPICSYWKKEAIRFVYLRPTIPCPFPRAEETVDVPGRRLVPSCEELLHVSYERDAMVTVSVEPEFCRSAPYKAVGYSLVERRYGYGSTGEVVTRKTPVRDIDRDIPEFLQRYGRLEMAE